MKRVFGAVVPALLAVAPAANAQSVGYDEALRAAVAEQPEVRARELQLAARRQAADAADELPDPRLRAGIANLPVTGPDLLDPTMMTMLEIGVEQEIPNLAERHARAGIASADIDFAHAQLAHSLHMARLGAAQAWVELAYAQHALVVADEALAEIAELVPVARSAVASGSARPGESLEIRRAVLEVEDARTAIEAGREAAQARLVRYIGAEEPFATGDIPSADV